MLIFSVETLALKRKFSLYYFKILVQVDTDSVIESKVLTCGVNTCSMNKVYIFIHLYFISSESRCKDGTQLYGLLYFYCFVCSFTIFMKLTNLLLVLIIFLSNGRKPKGLCNNNEGGGLFVATVKNSCKPYSFNLG